MFKIGDRVRIKNPTIAKMYERHGKTAMVISTISPFNISGTSGFSIRLDITKMDFFFYPEELELASEVNHKVDAVLNKLIDCTCKSLDLFNFGCKCEYIKQKRA